MNRIEQNQKAVKLQEVIGQLHTKATDNSERIMDLAGSISCNEDNWQELYPICFAMEAMVEQQIKLLQNWGGPKLVTMNNKNMLMESRTQIPADIVAVTQVSNELWNNLQDQGFRERIDADRMGDLVMVLNLHISHQSGWLAGLEKLAH